MRKALPLFLWLPLVAAGTSPQTTIPSPTTIATTAPQQLPGVGPSVMKLSDANPYACDSDTPPALASREMPSGVEAAVSAYAACRLDPQGRVLEALLLHNPVPSLAPQVVSSLQRWEFVAPKKSGAPVSGWATLRLDLKVEFSRPQITRASFVKVSPEEPLPVPLADRWDESWIAAAPPLKDLRGAEPPESLDLQPLPRKTKWLADRYRGPFPVKLWIEVSPQGKAVRLVPVGLKDPVLLLYLQRAAARWNFVPARKGGAAVSCWGILDLDGAIGYDVSLVRAASVKKSAGPADSGAR